jgi:hypothetical protein
MHPKQKLIEAARAAHELVFVHRQVYANLLETLEAHQRGTEYMADLWESIRGPQSDSAPKHQQTPMPESGVAPEPASSFPEPKIARAYVSPPGPPVDDAKLAVLASKFRVTGLPGLEEPKARKKPKHDPSPPPLDPRPNCPLNERVAKVDLLGLTDRQYAEILTAMGNTRLLIRHVTFSDQRPPRFVGDYIIAIGKVVHGMPMSTARASGIPLHVVTGSGSMLIAELKRYESTFEQVAA